MATLSLDHGGYSKREAYLKILGTQDPITFAQIPTELEVRDEIQWARYKLARTERACGAAELEYLAPQLAVVKEIRKLVLSEKLLNPGGDANGAFTVEVTVQGTPPPPLPAPIAPGEPPEEA